MSKGLSGSDARRVKNCDNYKLVKNIMVTHEIYKNFKVGEVYTIKQKTYGGEWKFLETTYGSGIPTKYMIFHKDEDGFVFVKRIGANGKVGVEVKCLTTQFPSHKFLVEPDEALMDAMLLGNEDEYDALAESKALASKKGKASRRNKKIEINYKCPLKAFERIKKLKVGDELWTAYTTFGDNIKKWKVGSITKRPVDNTPCSGSWHSSPGRTYLDKNCIEHGVNEVIEVTLLDMSNDRYKRDKVFDFTKFYKNTWDKIYEKTPFTKDDF